MGRNLLAAAAAFSLFVMPTAAFGQADNQVVAAPSAADAEAAARTARFDAILANANEDTAAGVGMALFGMTAQGTALPNFSWGIPRSPALTLAGLADTKVPTSDSLRDFVVQAPNTLGNEEQGQAIALDVTLARLLSETGATRLYQYRGQTLAEATAIAFHPGAAALSLSQQRAQRSERTLTSGEPAPDTYYQRWLRRSRVGVALYEGVEDTADPSKNIPARLAIGFSTSLWDESDPVMQRGPQGGSFLQECQADRTGELYFREQRDLQQRFADDQRALSVQGRREIGAAAFAHDLIDSAARLRSNSGVAPFALNSMNSYQDVAAFESGIRVLSQAIGEDATLRRVGLQATRDCAQRASMLAELRRDLDVGIGVLYRGDPGQVSDFDERGAAAWVAFRYPWGVNLVPDFGETLVSNQRETRGNADSTDDPLAGIDSYWLVAGSARFSHDEFIATGNNATPEIQVDQAEAWIGIERYSQRFRFGAFYGYSEVEAAEPAGEAFERSGERYVISAQYRLGDGELSGLWLGVTYGDTGSAANADNDDALMFSINFAPQPAYTIDWDPND